MLWVETTAAYCTVDWLPTVGFLPRLQPWVSALDIYEATRGGLLTTAYRVRPDPDVPTECLALES